MWPSDPARRPSTATRRRRASPFAQLRSSGPVTLPAAAVIPLPALRWRQGRPPAGSAPSGSGLGPRGGGDHGVLRDADGRRAAPVRRRSDRGDGRVDRHGAPSAACRPGRGVGRGAGRQGPSHRAAGSRTRAHRFERAHACLGADRVQAGQLETVPKASHTDTERIPTAACLPFGAGYDAIRPLTAASPGVGRAGRQTPVPDRCPSRPGVPWRRNFPLLLPIVAEAKRARAGRTGGRRPRDDIPGSPPPGRITAENIGVHPNLPDASPTPPSSGSGRVPPAPRSIQACGPGDHRGGARPSPGPRACTDHTIGPVSLTARRSGSAVAQPAMPARRGEG